MESILMAALGGSYDDSVETNKYFLVDTKQPAARVTPEPSPEVTEGAGLSVEDRMHILEVQVYELEKRNRALAAENRQLKFKCQTECQKAPEHRKEKCQISWATVADFAEANAQGVFYQGNKKLRTLVPKPFFNEIVDQPEAPQLVTTKAVISIPSISFRSIPHVNVPFTEINPLSHPPPLKSPKEIAVYGQPHVKTAFSQKKRRRSEMMKLNEQNVAAFLKQKPNILRRSN